MIPQEWRDFLEPYFKYKEYEFLKIFKTLKQEYAEDKVAVPYDNIFRALQLVSPLNVKCVILGSEPLATFYKEFGLANGLSFCVNKEHNDKRIPIHSGIKSIYKSMDESSLKHGFTVPNHGDTSAWAQQGVLLLNS